LSLTTQYDGKSRGCTLSAGKEMTMTILDAGCREVLEATEFVAIVTSGPDGPHIVATWGDYVRQLGIDDDTLLIPAGYYHHTEENLGRDARIQLLVASRRAEGTQGPGQGYVLEGTATVVTSGEEMDRVKDRFPWARGALVVHVEKASAHL